MKVLLFLGLFLYVAGPTLGGNVLVLCPMCSKSHKNVIEPTLEALASRNHTVTVVSSYKTAPHPNVRDILIMDDFDFFAKSNILEARKAGPLGMMSDNKIWKMIDEGCHRTYQNPDFMKLMNESWELVIIDAFSNHCLQGFIYKLQAPVIWSMPLPSPNAFASIFGNHLHPSFVPDLFLPFSEKMNLFERAVNLVVPEVLFSMYFARYPVYERIYRQYLGEDVPALRDLEANISMMLVNSHFSVNSPRPTMPDVVEIGGVHCREGKPLPKDLEDFVSGAKDGVILFSLGSIFRARDMPEETRKAFLNAFARLKQRVIWKWDFTVMTDLPPNVMLSKWLPVQDILAHPNTKLFITHGGLLSTQEAIYHGVPLVGIPLFADQDLNINRYVESGFAVSLEILDINEVKISEAIDTVLKNPVYKEKIQHLSLLFRDQPLSALNRAVFWAEYVMRHKGAPQLRSISRKMSFIQFHSLDVIAILLGLTLSISGLLAYACIRIFRKLCGSSLVPNMKKIQ